MLAKYNYTLLFLLRALVVFFGAVERLTVRKEFSGRMFQLFPLKKMVTIIKFQNLFWVTVVRNWHQELHLVVLKQCLDSNELLSLSISHELAQTVMHNQCLGAHKELAESFRSPSELCSDSCNDWRYRCSIHWVLGTLELLVTFLCVIRETLQGIVITGRKKKKKKYQVANVFVCVLEKGVCQGVTVCSSVLGEEWPANVLS